MKKNIPMLREVRREPRNDGWSNVVTLLGTNADKRYGSKIHYNLRDPGFYEELYAAGGVPARIVDLIPDEALRRFVDLTGQDNSVKAAFKDRCELLDVRGAFLKSWKWGRAFGGGCLHIVTDTTDPGSPLQKGERVIGLRDLSRWDLRVLTTDIEYDFGSPNWGHPRIYYLNVQMGSQYKGYPIHWTRMIRFDGQLVPRRTYIRNNYWHDSILNRIYDTIRDYQMSNEAVAAILQDFNVDVISMKNLAAMMGAGNEKKVHARIKMMQFAKSVLNSMIIDADNEQYENKGRAIEGVAELLRMQAERLVADTDIPHTKLLGESPDGSNATGNSTSQQWYNFLSGEQENYARPKLKRLFEILFPEIPDLEFKFLPLRELDAMEEAERRLKVAQADAVYLTNGVLDPTEVAASRFGGDDYSAETELDEEARAAGTLSMQQQPLLGDPNDPNAPQDPNDPNAPQDPNGGGAPAGDPDAGPGEGEPIEPITPPAELMAGSDEDTEDDQQAAGADTASAVKPGPNTASAVKQRKDASWEESKHKRGQGGKFGSGGKGASPKGTTPDKEGEEGYDRPAGPKRPMIGSEGGEVGIQSPGNHAEATQLHSEFQQHTAQAMQALKAAATPKAREQVRQQYQAAYAQYQKVMAPWVDQRGGVAPKKRAKLTTPSGAHIDADVKATTGGEEPEGTDDDLGRGASGVAGEQGEDNQAPSEPEPGPMRGHEGEGQDLTGVPPEEHPDPKGYDGVEAGENPGTEFDFRNEVAPKPANPVPSTKAFISQMMSEPMRDPRRDPHMKGPGIPNKPRTFLPTRGNGITAPSGFDPVKDAGSKGVAREGLHADHADTGALGNPLFDEGKPGEGTKPGEEKAPAQSAQANPKQGKPPAAGAMHPQGAKPAPGKPPVPGAKPPMAPQPAQPGQPAEEPQSPIAAAIEAGTEAIEKAQRGEQTDSDIAPKAATRAATIVVRRGDEILMGKRKDGKWALPGGHVERGESHHQGAMRELDEETGLKAKRLRFLGARMVEPSQGDRVHLNMYEHKASDEDKPTTKLDPDREFTQLRWVSTKAQLPEEIAGNLAHPGNAALMHLGMLK